MAVFGLCKTGGNDMHELEKDKEYQDQTFVAGNHRKVKVPIMELQLKELVSVFGYLAILFLLSAIIKLPLGNSPEAPAIGNAKAPWVFGAIQWMLYRFPAWLSGWLIPIIGMIIIIGLPWWGKIICYRLARIVFIVLCSIWTLLTILYFLSA